MRLIPSDPDVATVISRIDAKDLNLQPNFQRGEVWSRSKKQRLIDSILRDWHVPPIHVVELMDSRLQEVLDGQQRLVAIRDFRRNEFPIDGNIEPLDQRISSLHGKRYSDLSDQERRQFNQFTLRVFRIVEYNPSEPAELFYRLNQPTSLTGAEQRNAFVGAVRQQIKDLVNELEAHRLDQSFLGFSNSRMAYDDVLCRVALTAERRSIAEKISSSDLVDLYRSEKELSPRTIGGIRNAIALFAAARESGTRHQRFNKATLYSWLVFILRADRCKHEISAQEFPHFLQYFFDKEPLNSVVATSVLSTKAGIARNLFDIYEDRSTSRVSDVSSVIVRDGVIWLIYDMYREKVGKAPKTSDLLDHVGTLWPSERVTSEDFARILIDGDWGAFP